MLKLATWNVNSLRARIGRVTEWLKTAQPDVLMMQETKCKDAVFPALAFHELGYESVHHGDSQWNGVAIASRVGLEAPRAGFREVGSLIDSECRIVLATCGGVRLHSVYVPNGRIVDSERYVAKLRWLDRLRDELDATCDPSQMVGVFGDFNIAPEDRDVWDITQFVGATHVSPREREAFQRLCQWGLNDAVRIARPDEDSLFTWWDYRSGSFHRGWGMRIDLALVTTSLASHITSAVVDRDARKGPQPSDHAPLIVEFDL